MLFNKFGCSGPRTFFSFLSQSFQDQEGKIFHFLWEKCHTKWHKVKAFEKEKKVFFTFAFFLSLPSECRSNSFKTFDNCSFFTICVRQYFCASTKPFPKFFTVDISCSKFRYYLHWGCCDPEVGRDQPVENHCLRWLLKKDLAFSFPCPHCFIPQRPSFDPCFPI